MRCAWRPGGHSGVEELGGRALHCLVQLFTGYHDVGDEAGPGGRVRLRQREN
jgi:hypothetical protein